MWLGFGFYLMVGAGVALGVDCIFTTRKDLDGVGRAALAILSAVFWPFALASLITLALFAVCEK